MASLGGMKIAELKPKQEQLLMAMLSEPSFEEAVRKAGIARTTAFRYKKDPVFMDEFRKLKKEMIETTTAKLQLASNTAVQSLFEVSQSSKSDLARVQASKTILEFAYKGYELEDLAERLRRLESDDNNHYID